MITIFTNPRPFKGPFDTIQRNALKSWIKYGNGCQIVLFEDEEKTTSKVAKELGLDCITDVAFNKFGTPLFNDAVNKTKKIAKFEILANVNTDIMLFEDFFLAVKNVKKILNGEDFLMVGQRYNVDMDGKEIDFDAVDAKKDILDMVSSKGKLHMLAAMDYLVFPKKFNFNPPSFAIGRTTLDSWMIFCARLMKVPAIDATLSVKAVHQNHNYPRLKNNSADCEIERKINVKLAGGFKNMGTIRDADWILYPGELKRPKFPRRIFSILTLFYPWQLLLCAKRTLQNIRK